MKMSTASFSKLFEFEFPAKTVEFQINLPHCLLALFTKSSAQFATNGQW